MVLTRKALNDALKNLQRFHSCGRHYAQSQLDNLPLDKKVEQLLTITSQSSCSVEDRAAAAKHLGNVFAWQGKELFSSLDHQKRINVFLESFFRCIEGATSDKSVLDSMIAAFADIVHLCIADDEEWHDAVKEVLQGYAESEDNGERMMAWAVLGRVPRALDPEEFLDPMVKAIAKDLASTNVDLMFAGTCCIFGHILEFKWKSEIMEKLKELGEPLASAVEQLLHHRTFRVKVLELMFAWDEARGPYSSFFIGVESEKVAEGLLKVTKDSEEPHNIRVLSLKLVPKVHKDSLKEAVNLLRNLIQEQLFNHPGMETDFLEDLKSAWESYTYSFVRLFY